VLVLYNYVPQQDIGVIGSGWGYRKLGAGGKGGDGGSGGQPGGE